MRITIDNVYAEVSTVEAAAKMLARSRPEYAAINGVDIDTLRSRDTETAVEEVATALSAGDWYWLDGSAYCPACVECESPAIDAADPNIQRGGEVSVCSCCGTDYQA